MARVTYTKPTKDSLGYWRTTNPALDNLIDLFKKAQPADNGNFLVQVQGHPCKISPEWLLHHEVIDGDDEKRIYSYSIDPDTIVYALEDAEIEVDTLFPNLDDVSWEDRQQLYTVAFINLAIASDEDTCWKQVDWIQVVDTQSPRPVADIKPLTKKEQRDIARQLARKNRRLQS